MSTVDPDEFRDRSNEPHYFDCDWLGHRNEILEEAAKVCEQLPSFNPDDPGESYARAIRALQT